MNRRGFLRSIAGAVGVAIAGPPAATYVHQKFGLGFKLSLETAVQNDLDFEAIRRAVAAFGKMKELALHPNHLIVPPGLAPTMLALLGSSPEHSIIYKERVTPDRAASAAAVRRRRQASVSRQAATRPLRSGRADARHAAAAARPGPRDS